MKIFLELLKGSKQLTINHLLFVTEPFRNIMRSFFVTMIVFLLVLTPQQSLASSENIKTWNDVISNYSDTGTLGESLYLSMVIIQVIVTQWLEMNGQV